MTTEHYIPISILKLIFAFFDRTITEEEHDILDEWVCESDDNMQAFEICLELTLLNEEKGIHHSFSTDRP